MVLQAKIRSFRPSDYPAMVGRMKGKIKRRRMLGVAQRRKLHQAVAQASQRECRRTECVSGEGRGERSLGSISVQGILVSQKFCR